jgi:protein gp37
MIAWTDATWNPVTGCTKVSPGCKLCYAERMARRLKAMGRARYAKGFELTLQPDLLDLPLKWRRPRIVFVNSMSDLFHKDVPGEFIHRVFATMRKASWHTFQVLTKRSERLLEMNAEIDWPPNLWMGVSVENADYMHRIDHLRRTNAKIKFLALEPLLGPLPGLDLSGIDWVIAGGEAGPGARPMAQEWVADIRDRCVASGVPFFFEQWGGPSKKKSGRLLEGRTWDQMPAGRRAALPVVAG